MAEESGIGALAESLLDVVSAGEEQQEEEEKQPLEDSEAEEEETTDPYYEGSEEAENKDDEPAEKPAENETQEAKEKKSSSSVPIGRFNDVITERNDLRKQQQDQFTRFDKQQDEIISLRREMVDLVKAQNAPPVESPPDRLEDPDGFMDWQQRQIDAQQTQIQGFETTGRQTQEQTSAQQQVTDYARDKVGLLSEQHPDYPQAYAHLQQSVIDERVAGGDSRRGAEEFWEQIVSDEMVRQHRTGGDPALRMWQSAVTRGYVPAGANGDSGSAQAKAPTQPGPDQIAKANKSVANAGATADVDLSSMDVDSMTKEQFDKHFQNMKSKEMPAGFIFNH